MSKIKSIVAALALVLSLPAVAGAAERTKVQAPALDPRAFPKLTQIYVASGVRDNGGADFTGVATVIHCTNWTAAAKQVRFLIREFDGTVDANVTYAIGGLGTISAGTRDTAAYLEDQIMNTGIIEQGSVRIFSTSPQITCTAVVIDASTEAPIGTNLHLVRHNAWPNTQE